MKTAPTKKTSSLKKHSDLWYIMYFVSGLNMLLSSALQAPWQLSLSILCLLISLGLMKTYLKKYRDQKFRDSQPHFKFHDWFMENKDEAIRQGKEKGND